MAETVWKGRSIGFTVLMEVTASVRPGLRSRIVAWWRWRNGPPDAPPSVPLW